MLPERKKHRLEKEIYSQPGAYFITVCTKDRKSILSTIVGADDHIGPPVQPTKIGVGADDHIGPQVQLTKIGAVVDKYTKTIPGIGPYVIMPNHVHMILHISAKDPRSGPMCINRTPTEGAECGPVWSPAPTEANVLSLVRTWKTLITKALGQSIWQRSCYDHVIRDAQDYNIKAQYIADNPAKWLEDQYYTTED